MAAFVQREIRHLRERQPKQIILRNRQRVAFSVNGFADETFQLPGEGDSFSVVLNRGHGAMEGPATVVFSRSPIGSLVAVLRCANDVQLEYFVAHLMDPRI